LARVYINVLHNVSLTFIWHVFILTFYIMCLWHLFGTCLY